jgi:hypothetical protein
MAHSPAVRAGRGGENHCLYPFIIFDNLKPCWFADPLDLALAVRKRIHVSERPRWLPRAVH